MRNKFTKIALAATLGLALALTISCSFVGGMLQGLGNSLRVDEDEKINTKRWRDKLQNDWLIPGEGTEMIRIFARIESLFDKCDREGKTSSAKPGRWRRAVAEGWIHPGSNAKYVQENAITELISEGCLDEAY